MRKYRVTLTTEERKYLRGLIESGKVNRQKLNRAWLLLSLDEAAPGSGLLDREVAEGLDVSVRTIENLRKRFVEEGFEFALNGKKRVPNPAQIKIDGKVEAHIIAMSCGQAPAGYSRWSLRLLADRLVELKYIESISHESVRQVLKKTNLSPGNRSIT